jgi:hypothetical protein
MLGGSRAKSGEFRDGKNHDYIIHMEQHKPEFVIQNAVVMSKSFNMKIHPCALLV